MTATLGCNLAYLAANPQQRERIAEENCPESAMALDEG